ncbi:DUF1643 domain-containing protein [Photobacterium kishitanii]|uniref:DUF1643 domain-containing protein n=1 Tax=Photobacterium kishitanii TaxID=318456 RepID=UPI000434C667|nr:DUF1643 domain-containing protein [Photobacterium kishitanii]PSU86935.1 DUF1643 domain-containing protein [Photobacterium kishitanii]CEO39095.1 conserved hypothetical protein. In SS9 not in 3TCK [Photobacterium kishitanii]
MFKAVGVKTRINFTSNSNMNYKCYGHFYSSCELNFRDLLLITDLEDISDDIQIDLLVVMMNPGNSEPKDSNVRATIFSKPCVLTKPDNTQSQIMKVMGDNNFRTTIVINLSDIREPKSSLFTRKLNRFSFGSFGEGHSLFSESRCDELNQIIERCKASSVIFASGVNYKLRFLTSRAVSKFETNRIVGNKSKKGLFYHPLPRSQEKQQEWVKGINEQLKRVIS